MKAFYKAQAKSSMQKKLLVAAYPIVIIVCAITVIFAAVSGSREIDYVITDGNTNIMISSYSQSPESVLSEAGIKENIIDYQVHDMGEFVQITVYRPMTVTVVCDGHTTLTTLESGSVADVLSKLNIVLDSDDTLSHSLEEQVYDGMEISVTRVNTEYKTVITEIPNSTKYVDSPYLPYGTDKVITEGSSGSKETVYKGIYVDGILESFTVESQQITSEPIDAVIAHGTKGSPADLVSGSENDYVKASSSTTGGAAESAQSEAVISNTDAASENSVSTFSGETLAYSKVLNMTATAYTYNSGANITYSGAPAQVGIVAALPSTLPQGTKVYIVAADGSWEYGVAIVGDKPARNIIDLFMETYDECIQFGVRDALVYVLD